MGIWVKCTEISAYGKGAKAFVSTFLGTYKGVKKRIFEIGNRANKWAREKHILGPHEHEYYMEGF